jgi:hypothetical protein
LLPTFINGWSSATQLLFQVSLLTIEWSHPSKLRNYDLHLTTRLEHPQKKSALLKDFATTFRQNNYVQLGFKAASTTKFILLS